MSGEPTESTDGAAEWTDCDAAVMRLFEFLDGEMGAVDCVRLQQHLHDCAPCLREFEIDQALKALVKRSCGPAQAPPQLRTVIMQRVTTVHIVRTFE